MFIANRFPINPKLRRSDMFIASRFSINPKHRRSDMFIANRFPINPKLRRSDMEFTNLDSPSMGLDKERSSCRSYGALIVGLVPFYKHAAPTELRLLRSYVRGWMGYFGLASQLKLFDRLDQWLRRRIRACYWKQWRRSKRRREMLIRLGVPRRQAIRHARSRKGPWHMAKTIASGVGMTNAWLGEQGLLSLKTLWASLARLR